MGKTGKTEKGKGTQGTARSTVERESERRDEAEPSGKRRRDEAEPSGKRRRDEAEPSEKGRGTNGEKRRTGRK